MSIPSLHRRRLRLTTLLLCALALVLVAFSPSFGRATPGGSYRPTLPPDALTDGCWPLPGGARLDYGYQVRTDTVVDTATGPRRVLVLHYDEIGAREARARTRRAFERVGALDDVRVQVRDLPGVGADAPVRGVVTVVMPPSDPDSSREECRSRFSVKDFGTEGYLP